MTILFKKTSPLYQSRTRAMLKGAWVIAPLSIAVIPWGMLAGSLAIDAGLSPLETQFMSLTIFAGAAQLAAIGMLKAGVGLGSILLSTLLITSRHLLYAMALRKNISPLRLRWRLGLGFLLTDELFAIASLKQETETLFEPWYLLGAGLSFYLCWNASTLLGILAVNALPEFDQWGLDFAIVATFIAIIIPMIKNRSSLVCVFTVAVSAVICQLYQVQAGLLISTLLGMIVGVLYAKLTQEAVA
ncbi:AzlC family ABC transporter permease [Shewanella surugensis]|uniref:AzlC family ABC transporter permease n=1 Tax=Shewanella surugensis TaxID=212020 RepID=A0ABT0LD01_9GAMM|nr:AzlC family ABC transporter permease [Shewanella surugensis]MCL1125582.1 AzlC family ABC transporter permease [Shewanella surugensis]